MKYNNLPIRATLLCSGILAIACVNEIKENIEIGNIPIRFSTAISNTRVNGNVFSQGDEIGLFATLTNTSIEKERYIDNLKLKCGEASLLIGEKEVFYPEGDVTLDFIAYYPYLKEGLPTGSTSIPVSVQLNQSNAEGFSKSDFLIAHKSNIAPTKDAVKLSFQHQFVKLKIDLLPQAGEEINDLLTSNPTVTANGFYTQADCDLATGTLSNLHNAKIIKAHGNWKIENGKLTGKEIIVIPQAIEANKQSFLIDWNGKIYTCPISINDLNSNGQCTVSIKIAQSTNNTLTGVVGEIEDWGSPSQAESEGNYQITAIQTHALSFSSSDVYRVHKQGKAVAEICKEYLTANNINSRAIVVYPVVNEQTQLQKGTVLELLDATEDVHGGSVNFTTESNTLNYTPGTSAPIDVFYIDDKGEIAFQKPTSASAVNISSYMLRDIRGGSLQNYPIVKIGCQYWMKNELKATSYKDGTPLTQQTIIGEGAGYFLSNNPQAHYYNGEALLAGQLAPDGWKIPTEKEWNALKAYAGPTSTLKAGEWKSSTEGNEVCAATNQTGFSAYPVGLWLQTQTSTHQMIGYWATDDTGKNIPEKIVFLIGDSDDYYPGGSLAPGKEFYKALSVRCIKE